MSKYIFTAVLGLTLAGAAVAQDAPPTIAVVEEIEGKGKVLVNKGEEFVPAAEGTRLKAGDRVMVQDDSHADIQFDDACEYEIPENRIVTIPDRSPCAGGVPLVQQLNPTGAGAVGSVASDGRAGDILLAMAAETAIYFLITDDDDDDDEEDDDDTVSP